MKVISLTKKEKETEQNFLPQMVREYILHDRGNSLFLGDSFGNLPSPVQEGATIKKLFKFNEDDDGLKRKKNDTKNQAIRIEGKTEKNGVKKKESPEKIPKKDLNLNLDEIDAIVFQETVKKLKLKQSSREEYGADSGNR